MFSVVVAIDENGGIGKNGKIPWHIPSELKEFRSLTTSGHLNIVIMGRNTWESLPKKPLPDRVNFVISSTLEPQHDTSMPFCVFSTLEEALEKAHKTDATNAKASVFIIGGQKLYTQALQHPLCSVAYVTHIMQTFKCDVMFPIELLHQTYILGYKGPTMIHGNIKYMFCQYEKRDK